MTARDEMLRVEIHDRAVGIKKQTRLLVDGVKEYNGYISEEFYEDVFELDGIAEKIKKIHLKDLEVEEKP